MSQHNITLTVNGVEKELSVEPRTLLVHSLREELGYTGPNIGCESTMCGACTIQIDGEAVKSCTVLTVQADGSEITTIEGLSDDDLHPVQEAFKKEHGLQCGYCTPGFIMNVSAYLEKNADPSREEIREAIDGNLCRCTGYQNIVNAVERAAEGMSDADEGAVVTDGGESTGKVVDLSQSYPTPSTDHGNGNDE